MRLALWRRPVADFDQSMLTEPPPLASLACFQGMNERRFCRKVKRRLCRNAQALWFLQGHVGMALILNRKHSPTLAPCRCLPTLWPLQCVTASYYRVSGR